MLFGCCNEILLSIQMAKFQKFLSNNYIEKKQRYLLLYTRVRNHNAHVHNFFLNFYCKLFFINLVYSYHKEDCLATSKRRKMKPVVNYERCCPCICVPLKKMCVDFKN